MALVTAETAREYLRGFAAIEHDQQLDVWLAAAESIVQEWLGFPRDDNGDRELDANPYTIYLDGPSIADPRRLDLGIWPVISITSIGDDPDLWDYANNIVSSGDYTLVGEVGRVWLDPDASHAWGSTTRSIRVIVSAGYTASDKQLIAAVVLLAQHLYQIAHTPGVPNAATLEDRDPTVLMPPIVRQLAGRYRIGSSLVA